MFSKITNLQHKIIFLICSLILFIFPAAIITFSNITGDIDGTRIVSIPVRLLSCILLLYLLFKSKLKLDSPEFFLISIFTILYFIRIFLTATEIKQSFYQSLPEFVLYYFAYMFIPLACLFLAKNIKYDVAKLGKDLLLLSLFFLVPVNIFYGSYLGQLSRIEEVVSQDGVWANPLMLSYVSSIIFVLVLSNLLCDKKYFLSRPLLLLIFLLALVPFILGASRGALLAFIAFLLFTIIIQPLTVKTLRFYFITLISLPILIILSFKFEIGGLYRLLEVQEAVRDGASEYTRLTRWKLSFSQFSENPFFGNSLVEFTSRNYPHNIFMEILISTGSIGFTVFFLLIIRISYQAITIIRNTQNNLWVVGLFIIGFVGANFSGNITNQAYLALSMGLISNIYNSRENFEKK
jgi:O-antigen ligase